MNQQLPFTRVTEALTVAFEFDLLGETLDSQNKVYTLSPTKNFSTIGKLITFVFEGKKNVVKREGKKAVGIFGKLTPARTFLHINPLKTLKNK